MGGGVGCLGIKIKGEWGAGGGGLGGGGGRCSTVRFVNSLWFVEVLNKKLIIVDPRSPAGIIMERNSTEGPHLSPTYDHFFNRI